MKKVFFFLISLMMGISASADTNIVPQGVRALVFHWVQADIHGFLDQNGRSAPYSFKENLGAPLIERASPQAGALLNRLRTLDPGLVESMGLGTIDVQADAHVDAKAYAMAFGVSKNFMLVGVVPTYDATVTVKGDFTTSGSIRSAANTLRTNAVGNPNSSEMIALSQLLDQLPSINGNHLQGVLVNDYKYKPVGNWSAQGIGDLQFFGQVKYVDGPIYRQGAKMGAEIPTGRTDDPDDLVDVSFGKGHFTTFVEMLNDWYFLGDRIILAANARYAYQWSHRPRYRLIADPSLPISSESEELDRKPGNIATFNTEIDIKTISELYFYTMYTYALKEKDQIHGTRSDFDYHLLEERTNYQSQTAEIGLFFSTAKLFQRKAFPVPMRLGMSYGKVVAGLNIEKTEYAAMRMEFYF